MSPYGRRGSTFATALRQRLGDGELHQMLVDLARGKPWRPEARLPDGTVIQGEWQMPTTADRIRCVLELADRIYGKPVAATELAKAEMTAGEVEAIRALSDEELLDRVRQSLLARGQGGVIAALQSETDAPTDAEDK